MLFMGLIELISTSFSKYCKIMQQSMKNEVLIYRNDGLAQPTRKLIVELTFMDRNSVH